MIYNSGEVLEESGRVKRRHSMGTCRSLDECQRTWRSYGEVTMSADWQTIRFLSLPLNNLAYDVIYRIFFYFFTFRWCRAVWIGPNDDDYNDEW